MWTHFTLFSHASKIYLANKSLLFSPRGPSIYSTLVYRWNLMYLTLILHGVGTLMPWNIFINAKTVSYVSRLCTKLFSPEER
jgi:hypothetical protein